ncbi:MAG: hypothetical protein AAGA85_11760, partial [Bacteroidota bacterium]
ALSWTSTFDLVSSFFIGLGFKKHLGFFWVLFLFMPVQPKITDRLVAQILPLLSSPSLLRQASPNPTGMPSGARFSIP